jgi:DNA mismatch repair ATPase MutL
MPTGCWRWRRNSALGLVIEPFGPGTLAVRETPAILGPVNAEAILRDILDELDDAGTPPRCNPVSTPCSAAWPATAPSVRAAG